MTGLLSRRGGSFKNRIQLTRVTWRTKVTPTVTFVIEPRDETLQTVTQKFPGDVGNRFEIESCECCGGLLFEDPLESGGASPGAE